MRLLQRRMTILYFFQRFPNALLSMHSLFSLQYWLAVLHMIVTYGSQRICEQTCLQMTGQAILGISVRCGFEFLIQQYIGDNSNLKYRNIQLYDAAFQKQCAASVKCFKGKPASSSAILVDNQRSCEMRNSMMQCRTEDLKTSAPLAGIRGMGPSTSRKRRWIPSISSCS